MASLTPQYSANRTVREYTEKCYLPAASHYLKRAENNGSVGKKITAAKDLLDSKWNEIHFGNVEHDTIKDGYQFRVQVFCDQQVKDKISVELLANNESGGCPEVIKMHLKDTDNNGSEHQYSAEVKTSRDINDYTARVVSHYENIEVPMEDNHILWQH